MKSISRVSNVMEYLERCLSIQPSPSFLAEENRNLLYSLSAKHPHNTGDLILSPDTSKSSNLSLTGVEDNRVLTRGDTERETKERMPTTGLNLPNVLPSEERTMFKGKIRCGWLNKIRSHEYHDYDMYPARS